MHIFAGRVVSVVPGLPALLSMCYTNSAYIQLSSPSPQPARLHAECFTHGSSCGQLLYLPHDSVLQSKSACQEFCVTRASSRFAGCCICRSAHVILQEMQGSMGLRIVDQAAATAGEALVSAKVVSLSWYYSKFLGSGMSWPFLCNEICALKKKGLNKSLAESNLLFQLIS